MQILAGQLEEGMVVTRPGWVYADNRAPVVVEVVQVHVNARKGGWKGMVLSSPFLETVIIRARMRREGTPTKITVPPTEVFQLAVSS